MLRMWISSFLLLALLWPQHPARGARWAEEYSKVSVFYLYHSWEESHDDADEKISEGVFGLKAHQVFTPRLTVDFWGALTSAGYSPAADGQAEINLSSLSDTRIKGTYYFYERLLCAVASVNLPTGKTSLDDDEYLLAIAVADNSRKYIVRRFGQGLDLGAGIFLQPQQGNAEFRLGAGYLHKGKYQLREEPTTEYKFGNELYVIAAVEVAARPVGFSADLTLRKYSEDEADAVRVFQQGNTVRINGRISYLRQTQVAVGFGLLARGSAKILTAGGELTEESLKSGRNEVRIYLTGSHPLHPRWRGVVRLEYKQTTANDYPEDSTGYRPGGHYLGFGGGVNARLSLNWSAGLLATYYTGSMDNDHDLSGLGLAAVFTFRYW
jgi:hypothetical protein